MQKHQARLLLLLKTENETYLDEEEGIKGQEEEDKFNEDDLCENDDNIDYDE